VRHSRILTEKPNKMHPCIKNVLIPYLNVAQHVSGDTPPIIRSLKLHKQPLVLHMWKVVGRCQVAYATWQCPTTARPTTFHVCKTRGCLCNSGFLTIGGLSPETCWASFKYGIKHFDGLMHLVGFRVRIIICVDIMESQLTFKVSLFLKIFNFDKRIRPESCRINLLTPEFYI